MASIPMIGGWNPVIFEAPSNSSHCVILWLVAILSYTTSEPHCHILITNITTVVCVPVPKKMLTF